MSEQEEYTWEHYVALGAELKVRDEVALCAQLHQIAHDRANQAATKEAKLEELERVRVAAAVLDSWFGPDGEAHSVPPRAMVVQLRDALAAVQQEQNQKDDRNIAKIISSPPKEIRNLLEPATKD